MYGSFGSFSSHFAWFDLLPLLLSCWYSLWIVFLFVYPKQWGGMRFLACLNSFVHSFIFTFFFHSSCYFFSVFSFDMFSVHGYTKSSFSLSSTRMNICSYSVLFCRFFLFLRIAANVFFYSRIFSMPAMVVGTSAKSCHE